MTEKRDKVNVDDIIGFIKTDEPVNSVEEVRKLRGRETKTEKRYTYWEEDIGEMLIPQCRDNGKIVARSVYECVELLNEQHEANQQLKQELSDVYVEKGSNEYYKQLFEEKCKEIEVLENRVNWFIECIEQMGYKVVKE